MTSPDLLADLGGSGEPAGGDAGDERGEELFGGGEEVLALAGALVGEGGVAAGDKALAGEVVAGDLGEVLLVEAGTAGAARRRPSAS